MATTSISTIPTEVTQQIMREILANSIASNDRLPLPRFAEPPLSLTRVSLEWRQICLQTVELWQSIRVDSSTPTVPAQVIALWAFRAGVLPINIELKTDDRERGTALLSECMELSHRLQNVNLALSLEPFSTLVAHDGAFPMLRKLSLSIDSNVFADDITLTIRNAPLLRKVTLGDFPFLSVDTAWNQLTTLDMTVHELEAGILALQNYSNLVDLQFALRDAGGSLTIPPFTIPSLRSLVNSGESILPFLTVPNLVRLDIWGPGFSDMDQFSQELQALIQRSACRLRTLTFRMPPPITAAQLETFLRAVPSIIDLQLVFHVHDALMKIRTVLLSVGVLPALKTLRILYDVGNPEASFNLLLGVLAGRPTLEAFHLRARPGVLPPGVRERLLAFGGGGMQINIKDL
ncbi:hypothetical protein B0H19DRAFT_1135529 [Mycena capillaripes]|nr:hypothetical protein B0H19DRAFT_1135529 [Mycena capillaripes]